MYEFHPGQKFVISRCSDSSFVRTTWSLDRLAFFQSPLISTMLLSPQATLGGWLMIKGTDLARNKS